MTYWSFSSRGDRNNAKKMESVHGTILFLLTFSDSCALVATLTEVKV